MRKLALLLLALAGCQSFGAFSQPTTLPAHAVRLGANVQYDAFKVSDERIKTTDVAATADIGLSDSAELDLLLSVSTLEARLKYAFAKTDHFAAAGIVGAGLFTAYADQSSAAYVPAQLVVGYRPASDMVLFAGPSAWGALGFDSDTRGAGFNRGQAGLLGGGVAGAAFESPGFTFCPQVTVMAPLATGASGTVVQVGFGFGTQIR